jgi:hypothetical protein
MIPILAAAFTLAVGWERVWLRFQQNDPYMVRREFIVAAADMAKQRPLTGYGLGTFPEVYQRYAIKDFPFYANHAHNDPLCRRCSYGRSESLGAGPGRDHVACDRGFSFSAPRGLGLDVCHARTSLYGANAGRDRPTEAKPAISDDASSQGTA